MVKSVSSGNSQKDECGVEKQITYFAASNLDFTIEGCEVSVLQLCMQWPK